MYEIDKSFSLLIKSIDAMTIIEKMTYDINVSMIDDDNDNDDVFHLAIDS